MIEGDYTLRIMSDRSLLFDGGGGRLQKAGAHAGHPGRGERHGRCDPAGGAQQR